MKGVKRVGGQTGWRLVAQFAQDRGSGGGRADMGAGSGASVKLLCGPLSTTASAHEWKKGFQAFPKLFFSLLPLMLHVHVLLVQRSGVPTWGQRVPLQPSCPLAPLGPFFTVGNATPQSLRMR